MSLSEIEDTLHKMAGDRTCGDCQACCEVQAVQELGKPYSTKCQYQCGSGCQIYAHRPKSCQEYACLWRIGYGSDDDRPDKLGVIFGLNGDSITDEGAWVDLYETRSGVVVKEKDGGVSINVDRRFLTMMKAMRQFLENPLCAFKILGVRIFPYGSSIPADFEAVAPYAGPSSKLVRLFTVLATKPNDERLLLYLRPDEPNDNIQRETGKSG